VQARQRPGAVDLWPVPPAAGNSILAKLEVTRRAEAASYLARHTTIPGS
jgi:hypothetical protein